MKTRKRGAMVAPIETQAGTFYTFMYKDKVHVFGREGVQRILRPGETYDGQWMGDDAGIREEFCRELIKTSPPETLVDAADVVRAFGARLEVNFAHIYTRVTGVGPAHE